MNDDRPTDAPCPTCDRIRGVTPTRITQLNCPDDWHDRPTNDPLAEAADALRRTYPVPIKGQWLADKVDMAAARIRELEEERDALRTAGDALKGAVEGYGYFDPSSVRRAYWSRLADEYDAMDKATVSLTTGELRMLLQDAALAERAAEERQVTADYHRQQATSLRAEVQRLESLLRQG